MLAIPKAAAAARQGRTKMPAIPKAVAGVYQGRVKMPPQFQAPLPAFAAGV
jgi:hypothetical protein